MKSFLKRLGTAIGAAVLVSVAMNMNSLADWAGVPSEVVPVIAAAIGAAIPVIKSEESDA